MGLAKWKKIKIKVFGLVYSCENYRKKVLVLVQKY